MVDVESILFNLEPLKSHRKSQQDNGGGAFSSTPFSFLSNFTLRQLNYNCCHKVSYMDIRKFKCIYLSINILCVSSTLVSKNFKMTLVLNN